jgi:hypothetical protein
MNLILTIGFERLILKMRGPSNSSGGDDHPYLVRQLSVF